MQPEHGMDPEWVAALSGCRVPVASRALTEAQAQRSVFRYLAREHAREGRPAYGEIDAPLELHALVRLRRPRHVVEVGVSSGVSSAYLLNALALNGRGTLHSVELPTRPRTPNRRVRHPLGSWTLPPGRCPGWAVPPSLKGRWDLRLGDKARVLPLLAEELPSIDLFVYDVPHEDPGAQREFDGLDPRMVAGSIAIVDHGPGGALCAALQHWAHRRGASTAHRVATGLYGMRLPPG